MRCGLAISAFAPGSLTGLLAGSRRIAAELAIPPPPLGWRRVSARREPAWREAMRWSLIGLTASLAAGEVALFLFGP